MAKNVEPQGQVYSKDDFFDSLSCEALERLTIADGGGGRSGGGRGGGGGGDGNAGKRRRPRVATAQPLCGAAQAGHRDVWRDGHRAAQQLWARARPRAGPWARGALAPEASGASVSAQIHLAWACLVAGHAICLGFREVFYIGSRVLMVPCLGVCRATRAMAGARGARRRLLLLQQIERHGDKSQWQLLPFTRS